MSKRTILHIDPNPLPTLPPPHNPEAERAALGGLLIDPDEAERWADFLEVGDFQEPTYDLLCEAIKSLHEAGQPVDVVHVDEELKRLGTLRDVGQVYVHEVANSCASSHLTGSYVGIVVRNTVARKKLHVGNDLKMGTISSLEAISRLQALDDRLTAVEERLVGKEAGGAFSMRQLMGEQLPPIRWVVPDLLPEGLALLGAKQKIGKSWMVYGLGIALAAGGVWLGRQLEAGEVLYLALEDGKQRLQSRGRKLLGSAPVPEGLTFELRWPPLERDGLRKLDHYLTQHPRTRAVIIDTLARVRLPRAKNSDQYQEDYNTLASLKQIADAHHVLILVVHHTRKAAADDVFDELLGSVGIVAACDTLLVLARARGEADATLKITGRDIEGEGAYALRFDKVTGAWQMLGDAKEYASQARHQIRDAITDLQRAI